jgi:hypothetical protein
VSHKVRGLGANKKPFLIIAERCPGETSDFLKKGVKNLKIILVAQNTRNI